MIVEKPKKRKKNYRFAFLYFIMFIIMGAILVKLLYLQVYKYNDYKEKADVGSTRLMSEKAPRGNIYDIEGNVLATNSQTYTLTYMQTNESTEAFYQTMDKVFKILDENNEKLKDEFLLKVNSEGEFYFDFEGKSEEYKNAVELRFKRDRGLNEDIEKEEFGELERDLTDKEIESINKELMKISVEDVFYSLVKDYYLCELLFPVDATAEEEQALYSKYRDMSGQEITEELLTKYSMNEIRRYMMIKDSIKMQSFEGYKSVTISNNIKKETALIVYQELYNLPGMDVTLEPVRYYPYDNLASHVIGYVSSINGAQEEKYELRGYDASTDLIGVSGIESAFEEQLKGIKGGTTVKVNSQGRVTKELFKLEPYPGNNVHLTIDKDVQYAAQEALKDTIINLQSQGKNSATRGAVVAIEVNTGKVIAMASYPDFDPNDFAIPGELSDEKFEQYFYPDVEKLGKEHIRKTGANGSLDDLFPYNKNNVREDFYDVIPRPIYNYATQGLIPPGSTFKPLTAVAGLTEGVIYTGEYMNDTGMWSQGNIGPLENYGKRGNGATDVRKAIQVSSNYFFYETGYRLYTRNGSDIEALDTLAKYSWGFGLGVEQGKNPSTGIEIAENFGQAYNFISWKNNVADSMLFELVPKLEEGSFKGRVFVPFDFAYKDYDTDEVKEAKIILKENIKQTIYDIGTENQRTSVDKYIQELIPLVKDIMEVSDVYKKNVSNYEKKTSRKVDIDEQAQIIAFLIADFTISDKTVEVKSPGQIVSAAIGQGMNSFTPLQIANYVATLANGGTRYSVSVVDKITSPDGEVLMETVPEVLGEIDINPAHLKAVKDGMYRVNTSGSGRAHFANFPIQVAGKTGTADFGTDEQYDYQGRSPYSNYISFAPVDKPEIAIFGTVYDGKVGSASIPIHKAIYEAYFAEELLEIDSNYGEKSKTFEKYVLKAPKDNSNEIVGGEIKKESEEDKKSEDDKKEDSQDN